MRVLLLLGLFTLSGFAQATNNEGGCRDKCDPKDDHTELNQVQGQTQGQGQAQGQGQSQSAEAKAVAGASALVSSDNTNLVSNRNDVEVGVHTTDFNANSNKNENNNVAFGGSGGRGGEGGSAVQGQSQSSDNSNSSNNSASQSTNLVFEAPKTYRNTPSAFAPAVYASGVCTGGGFGLGASVPGYGASIGGSKVDKSCELRETARLLGGLGYDETGFVLLCISIPAVKEANGGKCTPPKAPVAPAVKPTKPDFESVPIPVGVVVQDVKG